MGRYRIIIGTCLRAGAREAAEAVKAAWAFVRRALTGIVFISILITGGVSCTDDPLGPEEQTEQTGHGGTDGSSGSGSDDDSNGDHGSMDPDDDADNSDHGNGSDEGSGTENDGEDSETGHGDSQEGGSDDGDEDNHAGNESNAGDENGTGSNNGENGSGSEGNDDDTNGGNSDDTGGSNGEGNSTDDDHPDSDDGDGDSWDVDMLRISYFPYYRPVDESSVPDETFRMLNVAVYAFGRVQSDCSIELPDKKYMTKLVERGHQNGCKVTLSFTGKTDVLSAISTNESKRTKLIDNLIDIVKNYDLDGVDNNWEFPSQSNGSAAGNLMLMRSLRERLDGIRKGMLLSMAIPSGKTVNANTRAIEDELADVCDWLGIMAYDDYSTSVEGRHHSPFELLEKGIEYWAGTRGMPKAKLVGGIPVYGRPSGMTQTGTVFSYKTILEKGGDPDSDYTYVTSTAYEDGKTPFMIYYNGRPTVRRKVRLCMDKGLGGYMFWETGEDAHDSRSLIRAAWLESIAD